MEITKGYEYIVEGHKKLEDFALGILFLTNAKSSRKGTVIDIHTIDGTNTVRIITQCEMDKEIKHYMGVIEHKLEIKLANLDRWEDGNKVMRDKMEKLNDEYLDNDNGIETYFFFENEDIDE